MGPLKCSESPLSWDVETQMLVGKEIDAESKQKGLGLIG